MSKLVKSNKKKTRLSGGLLRQSRRFQQYQIRKICSFNLFFHIKVVGSGNNQNYQLVCFTYKLQIMLIR
ncbi:hypothetical protein Hanom_Chr05g00469111 [Helianthus anomalus]